MQVRKPTPRRGVPRVVEFHSGGLLLRGYLYDQPSVSVPISRPAVVMTHGFSATATGMVADRYAQVIHAAGLTVLLFDGPCLGMSDGEPRGTLNRWTQLRAYRDALDFVAALPSVDASRLAVWGDSMSGATAIGVAAFDDRVRAVAVQVPACGRTLPPDDPDGAAFAMLRDIYHSDTLPAVRDRRGPMAVVSPDPSTMPSLLEPITAFRWFIDYGGHAGTGWQNQATLEVPDTPVVFHAGLCAPHLASASLWVVAEDDEMPGAASDVSLDAFGTAPEPKQLLLIEGGHFGLLYDHSSTFERASTAQAEFLARHVQADIGASP
ncbi:MAG TPA: acetylxylan esterase [Candidatus Limnocylindria bacterium]|nr:acetylxylan esterase [Candidatus Limnocylindria bacterium]